MAKTDRKGADRGNGSKLENKFSDMAVNLTAALLVWLFGVLVFLPLAVDVDPRGVAFLCSLIIIFAFSAFLFRGFRGFVEALDLASGVLALKWSEIKKIRGKRRVEKIRRKMRTLLYAFSVIVVYLLYLPFLCRIHPAVSGLSLILALFLIFIILLRK
ncbi:hypothetical protein CW702_01885 [Candidatus Bathyarchaeota archaeon]|nr:MAG: hypothetical protein CW702_01885 [Candidatus Bathyarchaeota archaeon]